MNKAVWVGKIIVWVVVIFFIALGIVLGTMYLWNWLVPELFSGPVINFWQTLGLLVLAKVFFGFGGRCHGHQTHGRGPWKYYWKEKWGSMTPEDREKFKQKMKEKWCYRGESGPGAESGTSNG